MNDEQNLELKRLAAKDLLRSLVNEVIDDFLGADRTYSQTEVRNAERGLAYLLEEGAYPAEADTGSDPWGTGEELGQVHTGLFLDIDECRCIIGPDGFEFIEGTGDSMTIAQEHLPMLARLFRQAIDIGLIASIA